MQIDPYTITPSQDGGPHSRGGVAGAGSGGCWRQGIRVALQDSGLSAVRRLRRVGLLDSGRSRGMGRGCSQVSLRETGH